MMAGQKQARLEKLLYPNVHAGKNWQKRGDHQPVPGTAVNHVVGALESTGFIGGFKPPIRGAPVHCFIFDSGL